MTSKIKINFTQPEQIHDYIRVTRPGIWLILSAIIIFLAGIFIWIFTGNIEIYFYENIYNTPQISRVFLTHDKIMQVKTGMHVRISESRITGQIINISSDVMPYNEIINITGLKNFAVMGLDNDDKYFQAQIKFPENKPDNEITKAVFITENIKPIHFLLR